MRHTVEVREESRLEVVLALQVSSHVVEEEAEEDELAHLQQLQLASSAPQIQYIANLFQRKYP